MTSEARLPAVREREAELRALFAPDGPLARVIEGDEPRPGQQTMAALIARGLRERRPVVVEAPTGVGKTMASLVPLLLTGERTLVSTATRALQDQLDRVDLPRLRALFPTLDWAVVKGFGAYVCLLHLRRLQTSARGEFADRTEVEAFRRLARWAEEETETGDLDAYPEALPARVREMVTSTAEECLRQECPHHAACFVFRARRRAARAQVVVVNHALLALDMALEGALLPPVPQVVVDEAHRLAEAVRRALGITVSAGRWHWLTGRIRRLCRPLFATDEARGVERLAAQAAGEADRYFDDWRAHLGDASRRLLGDEQAPAAALRAATDVLARAMADVPVGLSLEEQKLWQRSQELARRLVHDLTLVVTPDPGDGETVVRYAAAEEEMVRLVRLPLRVAEDLRTGLWEKTIPSPAAEDDPDRPPTETPPRPVQVVAVSATLAAPVPGRDAFAWFREETGCPETALTLRVPTPFPDRRCARLYLPEDPRALDPTRARDPRERDAYDDRLAAEILALSEFCPGGVFVLCAGAGALQALWERLAVDPESAVSRLRETGRLLLRQGPIPRTRLLRWFQENGQAMLLGLRSFWEGVDIPGAALSLVIIDKLPFAPPDDPVMAARSRALARATGDPLAGFVRLALPEATLLVKQGVGRLIRRRTDRGVMAVLDGRMVTKGYGRLVLQALPPAPVVRTIAAVRAFYADGHGNDEEE
jgi:ATP-dependent DNA helicase DinG